MPAIFGVLSKVAGSASLLPSCWFPAAVFFYRSGSAYVVAARLLVADFWQKKKRHVIYSSIIWKAQGAHSCDFREY